MFLNLCRYNHLNPWLKEAYLIKYGDKPQRWFRARNLL